jgi:phenylalanyl-tRNA synthetase beta chain
MKISLNWVKDFVTLETGLSNAALVENITLSVCEVEGFEETGGHLRWVRCARVTEITPHPAADQLSVVTVDHDGGISTVVCGASNFSVGDKVAYASPGTPLPGGITISRNRIRGVDSDGMLCAEDELGLTDDHSGLLLLSSDLEPGTTLDRVFPDQIDVVMEIDNKSITHRPDLWGHYGFARELGAIRCRPVKPLVFDPAILQGSGSGTIEVEVLAGPLVPRFTGIAVDNIEVAPSPDWIRYRLSRVGLRPINNMVDLTNYVMLEIGQPMHAFDADQIAGGKLIVRMADKGTRLMTLYQKSVELGENDMTICDANGASVVAGVIGGLNTGVTASTQAVFLEAANWDPTGIRKTSTRIGLRTDACQRFEKALDPEITIPAVQRALEIMKLTNPKMRVRGQLIDIVNKTYPPITIRTSVEFIQRRLGQNVEAATITGILGRLGFKVSETEGQLTVEVPSYRRTKDVSIPEDLVEEIGRIYGFNNITPQVPTFPVQRPVFNRQNQFARLIRSALSQNGYHEIINYPLTCSQTEAALDIHPERVMKLVNPVADHQDQMRTSLLPHLVQTLQENQKSALDFKLFEIGRLYLKTAEGRIQEPNRLVCAVSRQRSRPGVAFYQLKSDLLRLFSCLQLPNIDWQPLSTDEHRRYQHSRISAALVTGDTLLGWVFALSPEFMDQMGLRDEICLADLDYDAIYGFEKMEYRYQPVPRFPAVFFELSLVVPSHLFFKTIQEIIVGVSPLVVKVGFLDTYTLKHLPDRQSVSISIEFRSDSKTLESDEIKQLQDDVIAALAAKGYHLREADSAI